MQEETQVSRWSSGTVPAVSQEVSDNVSVSEVYLDGKLQKAEYIDDDEKSYGIFIHSLILSNYAEVIKVNTTQVDVMDNEYERAIFHYTADKGFNKKLIDSIAPRVDNLTIQAGDGLRASTHLINDRIRIISKDTPDQVMKRCSYILLDSKYVKITRRIFTEINDVLRDMLDRCKNVYALAIKDLAAAERIARLELTASEMTLVALVGMA